MSTQPEKSIMTMLSVSDYRFALVGFLQEKDEIEHCKQRLAAVEMREEQTKGLRDILDRLSLGDMDAEFEAERRHLQEKTAELERALLITARRLVETGSKVHELGYPIDESVMSSAKELIATSTIPTEISLREYLADTSIRRRRKVQLIASRYMRAFRHFLKCKDQSETVQLDRQSSGHWGLHAGALKRFLHQEESKQIEARIFREGMDFSRSTRKSKIKLTKAAKELLDIIKFMREYGLPVDQSVVYMAEQEMPKQPWSV